MHLLSKHEKISKVWYTFSKKEALGEFAFSVSLGSQYLHLSPLGMVDSLAL